jgi:hypothetical protein
MHSFAHDLDKLIAKHLGKPIYGDESSTSSTPSMPAPIHSRSRPTVFRFRMKAKRSSGSGFALVHRPAPGRLPLRDGSAVPP